MDWAAALSFWTWGNNALGAFHLYAAVAALIAGPLVFFRKKGDLVHRVLGMIYVLAMYMMNISALSLYGLTGAVNLFHYFAMASLFTLTLGFIAILIYAANRSTMALDLHLQMMPWSYLGLVMAAVAESVTRATPRLFVNDVDLSMFWRVIFVISIIGGVFGAAITAILVRRVRRRWIPASAGGR